MCPVPVVNIYDVWSSPDPNIDVDVLMPNGIIINLNVAKETTFSEIKEV
jgi:hypothetical protein